MSQPFASAWRKYDRAHFHFEALKTDLERIRDSKLDTAMMDFEQEGREVLTLPDGSQWILVVVLARIGRQPPTLSDDFPFLFGDAIQNYRAALDHLVWGLVSRFRRGKGRISRRLAKEVQFPMHPTARAFADLKEKRTPGVPDAPHRAFLKRYQPYRRGRGPQSIRWLRYFSDRDKHRVVVPAVMVPKNFQLRVQTPPGVSVIHQEPLVTRPTVLRPETPVTRLTLLAAAEEGREASVRVNSSFELLPVVGRRVPAQTILTMIDETVAEIIRGIEAM